MMEDDHQWKITLGGRRPLVEDNLLWKTTIIGSQPSVEDTLQWKTPFVGRRPSLEDDLCWKTTFGGRQSSVEDDLRWKMTFGGRRSSVDPCMLPTPLCGIFHFSSPPKSYLFLNLILLTPFFLIILSTLFLASQFNLKYINVVLEVG